MKPMASLASVGMVAFSLSAATQEVTSITSADIVAATTSAASDLSCLNFRINGVCLFLFCTPAGCTVNTTVLYRHFNPALVVTSYNTLGESPWVEIQAAFGAAQVASNQGQFAAFGINPLSIPGGGKFADDKKSSADDDKPERTDHLIFKDAEVIGSPGNALSLGASLGLPVFCPTTDVFPLFPYFLSGLDAFAWRSGLTEIVYPETFIPGLSDIGDFPFNTWGSVHPRHGFLNTPEDPKAGAVMAQRAADIATREFQPHVSIPVGSVTGLPATGVVVFEPDPVEENNPESARWQLLMPITETSCEVFGEDDTLDVFDGWSDDKVSAGSDYAWALWRPYRCCEQDGIFLTKIEVLPE